MIVYNFELFVFPGAYPVTCSCYDIAFQINIHFFPPVPLQGENLSPRQWLHILQLSCYNSISVACYRIEMFQYFYFVFLPITNFGYGLNKVIWYQCLYDRIQCMDVIWLQQLHDLTQVTTEVTWPVPFHLYILAACEVKLYTDVWGNSGTAKSFVYNWLCGIWSVQKLILPNIKPAC